MRPGYSREGPGSAAACHSAADEDALVEPMTPAPSFRAWTIAVAPSLVFILPPAFQCFHCPETCMTSLRQTQDAAMPWPQSPPAPRGQNPNPDMAGEALHDQRLLSMTASCLGLSSRPHSFLSIPCLPGSPGQSDPRFFHMSLPLPMLCLLTPLPPLPPPQGPPTHPVFLELCYHFPCPPGTAQWVSSPRCHVTAFGLGFLSPSPLGWAGSS